MCEISAQRLEIENFLTAINYKTNSAELALKIVISITTEHKDIFSDISCVQVTANQFHFLYTFRVKLTFVHRFMLFFPLNEKCIKN